MTTLFVTYAGDTGTHFDREYYVNTHLPLVMQSWRQYGIETAAAFFPPADGAGTIAVCILQFRDKAAVDASFGSPEASRVLADVKNFTAVAPSISVAAPL